MPDTKNMICEQQECKTLLRIISTAKIISMILVVLYHSLLTLNGMWGGVNWSYSAGQKFAAWLNTFHVAVFVFCSGALFSYKQYDSIRTISNSIKRRFARLLVPYFIVSVFWAIPFRIAFFKDSVGTILKNFCLIIQPAQLWFLPMLFLIYALYRLFYRKVSGAKSIIVLISLMIINLLSTILWEKIPLGVFQIGNVLKYSLFFELGILFYETRKFHKIVVNRIDALCVFLLLSVGLFIVSLNQNSHLIKCIANMLSGICGTLAVMSISAQICRAGISKPVEYLQDQSMGIYLIHQQLLYITMRFLAPVISLRSLFVFLNFVFAMCTSYFLSLLIRKSKAGRIALGG